MKNAMLCLVVVVAALAYTGCGQEELAQIPYRPDFVQLVEGGNVTQVEVVQEPSGVTYIRGETKSGDSPGRFKVYIPPLDDSLREFLAKNQVDYQVTSKNPVLSQYAAAALPLLALLIWLAIIIFVLTLAVRLVRAVERIAKNTEK